MRGAVDAGGAELLGDQEAVLLVADDDRRREAPATGAQRGFLRAACGRRCSGQSCLGKLSRETGQRRVPEPPERMTGMIAGVSVI